MLIEALLTMLAVAAPQKAPAVFAAPASALTMTPSPAYRQEARAVDNWRIESALALEMAPLAAIRRAVSAEAGEPGRCVKLNNYWCIKSAGWSGEIAADPDGHVAFASAAEGAAVAALLLRRYYVDYGRHSARAIVERWAPAQCALGVVAPSRSVTAAFLARTAPRAGAARVPAPRLAPIRLAPRGIQNTLRARWLAAHARGGVDRKMALGGGADRKKARQPVATTIDLMPKIDLMPAPSIMVGVSERPAPRNRRAEPKTKAPALPTTLADLAPLPAPLPAPDIGVTSCAGEIARIANYAAAVAQGVVGGPNEDLGLFTADGLPTDNLAKAMANMAAVEIGPARPRAALIKVAIAQLRQTLEASAKNGAGAPVAPPTEAGSADQERAISSRARP